MFRRLTAVWRRAVARVARERLDRELAEEIRGHLEMRRNALIETGMDPRDAELAARRQFGNVTFMREESRAMWGFGWLDTVEQDVRYAVRLLRRTPWFTAVAVLSLTVGIGSAATVFHIVNTVLLRSLPVRAPHELRTFTARLAWGANAKHLGGVDRSTFREMERAADFADLIGFQVVDIEVADGGGTAPRSLVAEAVTESYFGVLGISAAAGRLLTAEDATSTPVPVVVSDRLWKAAFGGAPSLASRAISINGIPAAIVGVASSFRGVVADRPADVFIPLSAAPRVDARSTSMPVRVLARLRPNVSPAVAEQRMAALLLEAGPSMVRQGELHVSLPDARLGVSDARIPLTRPLLIALVFAGVLLLVACANTGGLLVARSAARQGEFGLRVAIGASRARLIRQLTVEALLLALIAGCSALLLATIAAPLVLTIIPAGSVAPAFDLRFDWRLGAFTGLLTAGAAAIAGGVSLFRVARTEPAHILNANARTVVAGSRRITRLLITAQVASSLLLIVGAAATVRTLSNLRAVDPGFEAGEAFAVRVETTRRTSAPTALATYYQALLERIAGEPSVARVSVSQVGLMSGAETTGTVDVAGFSPRSEDDRWVRLFWVGPAFFETVGMPIIVGRGLEAHDATARERVAVVNERFARFYFGTPDQAIGGTVNRDVRIVGVVADARYDSLRADFARAMFVPFTQAPPRAAMTYIVRPSGERTLAVQATIAAIRAHDPQLRPAVTLLSDQIASTMLREHFMAAIAAILSCLGLFLSCAGLYAAVSYATAERRGEFAVRMTLGATARDIITLVLREPLRMTLAGILVGLPGAYVVLHATSSLLYGVAPFDLVSVGTGCVVLIAAATVAALWPALCAGRTNPIDVLRAQ